MKITKSATAILRKLLEKSEFKYLRITTVGNSRSGFLFHIELTSAKKRNDIIDDSLGVSLIMDSQTYAYLLESSISYDKKTNELVITIK